MRVSEAQNSGDWEDFLLSRPWSPFLQSWRMGEVYEAMGQKVIRLKICGDDGEISGICQAVVVPARRGRHLAVSYGPVLRVAKFNMGELADILKKSAIENRCLFVRLSPFWMMGDSGADELKNSGFRDSPLHMLAEHVWYLDLRGKTEEDVLSGMRKNTRNLIRRSAREGVTVSVSVDPVMDLPIFLSLHEETRKRHGFTPYSDEFFRRQVGCFAMRGGMENKKSDGCVMYIARYKGEPVAASIHMVYGGETSYHHGASTAKYPKCFASYLLQWTAIKDALKRGDHVFNFWGISPEGVRKHPFSGVRTFKTGFGGRLMELVHCMDLPVSPRYFITFGIEALRKVRRGF